MTRPEPTPDPRHRDHSGYPGHPDHPDHPDPPRAPAAERTLSSSAYVQDRGDPDPQVLAALTRAASQPSTDADRELMRVVAAARWLVPALTVAVDTELRDGSRVEGKPEMATVTLTAPDGRRGLPVFTGVSALTAWDPKARPLPVGADLAAQTAIGEECDTLLIDLGSDHALALRPSMVWALAMARPWLPAHEDPEVAAAVATVLGNEPTVARHELSDGEPPASGVLRLTMWLRPGLDATGVEALATRVGERLAADGELRARIDGLSFAVRPAEDSAND
ncbi:MAG: hypothetical protein CSA84_07245 [Actinomycetales bacterium]|nr:MAG: hypothetical protein CSA84_07245 [Actinomycetales bacterium]